MPDIKEINGRYYDFAPRNESFLITAKELKEVGIKNFYFMLRVNNPRAAYIDPFNPRITPQEAAVLMQEYRTNIWAFIRDAVRVQSDKGTVPFCLHRGLAAVTWCFERSQDCCICEPRQTYKTTGTIAGPLQWSFQMSSDMSMHFFGKDNSNTKQNLRHLKTDIELLPKWLQFTRYMKNGKIENAKMSAEYIENGKTRNKLFIHPKPTSEDMAISMGRGFSGTVLYFDEAYHMPHFDLVLSNSSPMFITAHENAVSVGKPSARIFTCTPGDLDTKIGRDAYPVISSMIPWSEKIYDMTDDEILAYKNTYRDEFNRMAEFPDRQVIDVFYMEYQYYQLRKTYDWVLEQFSASGDKRAVRREILLQNLRGSDNSFVDPEDIEYLTSNIKKSNREILLCRKWILKVYDHGAKSLYNVEDPFDRDIPYIIGVDPAGGDSGKRGDYFAVTVINPNNLQVAAEFHSQFMGGPDGLRMLQELVLEYMPKACVVIERNSVGQYLIQWLMESDIADNLYWSEKGAEKEIDMLSAEPKEKGLKSMSDRYGKYGTQLTHAVRSAMFELLRMHIRECRELMTTEYLVNDICKLTIINGKPQAERGFHDDSLFSYLHAIYVYYTGNNLDLFGITRKAFPTYNEEEDIIHRDEGIVVNDVFRSMGITPKEETFEEHYKRAIETAQAQTQEMVDKLSFVEAFGYEPSHSDVPLGETTVDIAPHFFDMINGVDGSW